MYHKDTKFAVNDWLKFPSTFDEITDRHELYIMYEIPQVALFLGNFTFENNGTSELTENVEL